jgi:hypothetical protein
MQHLEVCGYAIFIENYNFYPNATTNWIHKKQIVKPAPCNQFRLLSYTRRVYPFPSCTHCVNKYIVTQRLLLYISAALLFEEPKVLPTQCVYAAHNGQRLYGKMAFIVCHVVIKFSSK